MGEKLGKNFFEIQFFEIVLNRSEEEGRFRGEEKDKGRFIPPYSSSLLKILKNGSERRRSVIEGE